MLRRYNCNNIKKNSDNDDKNKNQIDDANHDHNNDTIIIIITVTIPVILFVITILRKLTPDQSKISPASVKPGPMRWQRRVSARIPEAVQLASPATALARSFQRTRASLGQKAQQQNKEIGNLTHLSADLSATTV